MCTKPLAPSDAAVNTPLANASSVTLTLTTCVGSRSAMLNEEKGETVALSLTV